MTSLLPEVKEFRLDFGLLPGSGQLLVECPISSYNLWLCACRSARVALRPGLDDARLGGAFRWEASRRDEAVEFNVAQLMKEATGARREYALDDGIDDLDDGLAPLSNLTGKLELLRIHSGVLASGDFRVTLSLQCGRCLEAVTQEVAVRFAESFRPLTDVQTGRFLPPEEFEGQAEDLTDEALLIDAQHILDITEVVRQNIWLSVPIVAACDYLDPASGKPDQDACPKYIGLLSETKLTGEEGEESTAEAAGIDPRWQSLLALQKELTSD